MIINRRTHFRDRKSLKKGQGLVKSIRFKNHRYIGDPINAVRIFNELKADELVFLDILANKQDQRLAQKASDFWLS